MGKEGGKGREGEGGVREGGGWEGEGGGRGGRGEGGGREEQREKKVNADLCAITVIELHVLYLDEVRKVERRLLNASLSLEILPFEAPVAWNRN